MPEQPFYKPRSHCNLWGNIKFRERRKKRGRKITMTERNCWYESQTYLNNIVTSPKTASEETSVAINTGTNQCNKHDLWFGLSQFCPDSSTEPVRTTTGGKTEHRKTGILESVAPVHFLWYHLPYQYKWCKRGNGWIHLSLQCCCVSVHSNIPSVAKNMQAGSSITTKTCFEAF